MRSTLIRRPVLILAGVAAVTALVGGGALGAAAAPFYDQGGCQVNHLSDGPIAGGSQCAGVDFGTRKMSQSAFQGADLSGASFANGDVQAAVFKGANIAGVDFTNTKMAAADFTGAGIVPDVLNVPATGADGAAVTITPNLPEGMTFGGCAIAGTPVTDGAMFPIGTSGLLCTFTTGQPDTATAVVQVQVTATTPIAEEPLFTTMATAPAASNQSMLSSPTTWIWIGGAAVVVIGGIVAFAVSRVLGRRRS